MLIKKNINVYRKAVKLRKSGNSYSEIKAELGVAKSTLSDWLNKKPWSDSIKKDLNNKYLPKNRYRIMLMNKSRALKRSSVIADILEKQMRNIIK